MSNILTIVCDGEEYRWAPAHSTPSASAAVTELPNVIEELKARGAEVVVDFGAGRGRNAPLLAHAFKRLVLVEHEPNLVHLKRTLGSCRSRNYDIYTWDDYRRDGAIRVDAVIFCCVIHTVPTGQLREEVVRTSLRKLNKGGLMVFITPRSDSKYSATALADAVDFEDGIVRLRANHTFSFYRNYTREQLCEFLAGLGLKAIATIPSHNRLILVSEYCPLRTKADRATLE